MNIKVDLKTLVIVFLVCVLAFGGYHSFASAKAEDEQPLESTLHEGGTISGDGVVPGGPGFIMISPFSFIPYGTGGPWSSSGGGIYNPSTSTAEFAAGLSLPHGATITKMTLYYRDSSSTTNFILRLYQNDGTGTLEMLTELTTADSAASYRYLSTDSSPITVVDNQMYSYFLYVYIPGNQAGSLMLTNVRFDYEYTTTLPTVFK